MLVQSEGDQAAYPQQERQVMSHSREFQTVDYWFPMENALFMLAVDLKRLFNEDGLNKATGTKPRILSVAFLDGEQQVDAHIYYRHGRESRKDTVIHPGNVNPYPDIDFTSRPINFSEEISGEIDGFSYNQIRVRDITAEVLNLTELRLGKESIRINDWEDPVDDFADLDGLPNFHDLAFELESEDINLHGLITMAYDCYRATP